MHLMRVKLTFLASKRNTILPLNYNHAVAGLIYRTVGNASEEFAARLHDEGFEADRRRFKLFTFSRLFVKSRRVIGDRMVLEAPEVSLQVSSPVGDFIEHFVSGLFQSERFNIAGSEFTLAGAETIAPPEFSERMSIPRARADHRVCARRAEPRPVFEFGRRLVRDHRAQSSAQVPGIIWPRAF